MSTYGRGKRTENAPERIDYKQLAGETYSYDSSDENTISVIKENGDTINVKNNYVNKHIPQLMFRSYSESDLRKSQEKQQKQEAQNGRTNVNGTNGTNGTTNNNNDDNSVYKIQYVQDGSELTVENLVDEDTSLSIHLPIFVKDTPESIGMKVPKKTQGKDGITIRDIGAMVGMAEPITVMDCRTQEEVDGWIFRDLVDYFEDDDRLYQSRKCQKTPDRVLNQISLEFSHTPMKNQIESPLFVRQLDWIDNMWPSHLRMAGHYPSVQKYCLTSTCGCFTDFHIDFGGTSVWYHVLNGRKMFLLIPPTPRNVQLYEDWLCRKDQGNIFFPDMVDENGHDGVSPCIRVTLEQGQTLLIPTGWIHAVYTPVDSIVVGGNFLHGFDMNGQIDIHCLETRTRVPTKFKFPFFIPITFYAGVSYLKKLLNSDAIIYKEEVEGLPRLIESLKLWSGQASEQTGKEKLGSLTHCTGECMKLLNGLGGIKNMEELINALRTELERIKTDGLGDRGKNINVRLLRPVSPNSQSDTSQDMAIQRPRIKLSLGRNKDQPQGVISPSNEDIMVHVNAEGKKRKAMAGDIRSNYGQPDADDDWVPGAKKLQLKASKATKTPKENQKVKVKSLQTKKSLAPKPVRQKPQTTSRQRLKKKFKF